MITGKPDELVYSSTQLTVVDVDGPPLEHVMAMVTSLCELVNVTFVVAAGPRMTLLTS